MNEDEKELIELRESLKRYVALTNDYLTRDRLINNPDLDLAFLKGTVDLLNAITRRMIALQGNIEKEDSP